MMQQSRCFCVLWKQICKKLYGAVLRNSSDQDLAVMFESQHLIMDGTFKISPDAASRKFKLFMHREVLSMRLFLLPMLSCIQKSKHCTSVVSQIRQKLEINHGGIGNVIIIFNLSRRLWACISSGHSPSVSGSRNQVIQLSFFSVS